MRQALEHAGGAAFASCGAVWQAGAATRGGSVCSAAGSSACDGAGMVWGEGEGHQIAGEWVMALRAGWEMRERWRDGALTGKFKLELGEVTGP